jgi:DNA-binding GntR family transcriptional regulator
MEPNRKIEALPDLDRPGSAVNIVVEALLASLRGGMLVPGQKLGEVDLAQRYGVARTTIREALQRMEVAGYLIQERHRGFQVRTLNRARLREIYQMRGVLDGLAARLAAPNFARDPAGLDAIVQAMETAAGNADLRTFTALNREFHELIRTMSGNEMLVEMLNRLDQSTYHLQFRLLIERPQVFATQEDHRRISAALRTGDAETAAREAGEHAEHSLRELLKLPDAMFSPD